ncbi:MAG: hypothetical protein H6741_12695 [Alphaproteobacteria bacterium]|nr:hypothetical protein [Alphaproteobacteria bacterium]
MLLLLALVACDNGGPSLDDAPPVLLCGGEGVLTASGDGLGVVVTDGLSEDPQLVLPLWRLELTGGLSEGSAAITELTISLPDARVKMTSHRDVELTLDASLGLVTGSYDLVVVDPFGREGRLEAALVVAAEPWITDVAPEEVCHEAEPQSVILSGAGFVVVDGALPTATVASIDMPVVAASDCEPVMGSEDAEVCGQIELEMDPGRAPLGYSDIVITNPAPLDCADSAPAEIKANPSPTLLELQPGAVCRYGGSFELIGEDITPDTTFLIDGRAPLSTTWIDGSTVAMEVGELEPGSYDVTALSPDGCEVVLPEALSVSEAPLLFYIDPPAVYSGGPAEVTAYLADVTGEVSEVRIENTSTGEVTEAEWTWDPELPSILRVVVPNDLVVGSYELSFVQDGECQGDSGGVFYVRGPNDVAIESVEPGYAWTFDHTPITIHAPNPIPNGQVGFQDTPTAFLVGPDGGSDTRRLLGLTWLDEYSLTATVPTGLTPGTYSLLVVNPDERVGFLRSALEVTQEGPPRINTVNPSALPNQGNQTVTIRGRDFRDPEVEISCNESGSITTVAGNVTDWNYATVTASLPASRFNRAICLLRLVNDDGSEALYSAISITNPAQNLFPWQDGTDMVVGRRAPAAASGRTSAVDRYVFAFGGDSGDYTSAMDSIEVARVGVYGDLEEWALLRDPLPEARTYAAAVLLDDFIYVIGGNNGTSAQNTALRAHILDPLEVPYPDEFEIARGENTGLDPGTWRYQISALYAEDDPTNPGGESLPSEVVELTLPDMGVRMRPTLRWDPVDDAVGYRVYRNDGQGGPMEWVLDVTPGRFTDIGRETDPTYTPKIAGGLGEWADVGPMIKRREGPCVAVGYDPNPDPELAYIYVAGGRDGAGNELATVEVMEVRIEGAGRQVTSGWTQLPDQLGEPRWQCAGYTVDANLHTVVDEDETWVYFAGGLTANGASQDVQVGTLQPGGTLGDWQTISNLSPARAGFASASASNFLYAFGGHNARPSSTGVSAELTSSNLPDVRNWNSLSTSLSEARYLAGSAQESAVIFVLGGQTDDSDASNTTDWTNF